MDYIIHFVAGFLMAYIGLIPPGMLNMTTLRTTLNEGIKKGVTFAAGAAIVVIFHAGIALYFANYLANHPEVILQLRYVGIIVFLILAIFFFIQGRKTFKGEGKTKKGNPFIAGLFMSSMNMLGIPFYLGIGTLLETKGYITITAPLMYVVVIGAAIGAFALFFTYAYFANILVKKITFVARNINYILSILFLLLAVITMVNVVQNGS